MDNAGIANLATVAVSPADALVRVIDVNLRGVQALRSIVPCPLADLAIQRQSTAVVPQLEAEVQALGRSFGTHSVGNWHG